MSYESAPATHMVAINCAICRRDLVDALSVEVGVGPVCRKRWLKELEALDEDDVSRQAANKIIHAIACNQGDDNLGKIKELFALGFPGVVQAIMRTLARVKIEEGNLGYLIKTPYCEDSVTAWRRVPGRRWDKDAKANWVPKSAKGHAFIVLLSYHEGEMAMGPKGPFVIRRNGGKNGEA